MRDFRFRIGQVDQLVVLSSFSIVHVRENGFEFKYERQRFGFG